MLIRQVLSVSHAATVIWIIGLSALIMPALTAASVQKTVSIAECKIDGFGLGDSADQVRELFGEPEQDSVVKSQLNEYQHREYEYDGMRIVFSTNSRSVMSFHVSSPAFRLRSGIGVGSIWTDIIEALGPGSFKSSGESVSYSYQVVNSKGDPVPARLRFAIENELVTSFSVTTTQ